ncbi:MAG: hypothetical protein HY233_08695 [Acidobacteriales bacterium]|nr:hypothetical protein [Terriglobales bacterium]
MTNAKALEIWTAQTICDVGILLSIISLLLHLGRPYFERILGRLTLRVAADLWWLAYVVLRDGTLFFAVLFGFWHLNLDLMADIKIGLPFVPFGTVALATALLFKVFSNSEDLTRSYRASTSLVLAGAMLNTIGYVFIMEAPGEEYAAAKTGFWQTMLSWRSNLNPQLSTASFYISMGMMLVILLFACVRGFQLVAESASKRKEQRLARAVPVEAGVQNHVHP